MEEQQRERLERLSEAVRVSRTVWTDDCDARDTEIYELEASGVALRDIARVAGMAPSHAHRVVVEQTARRQGAT